MSYFVYRSLTPDKRRIRLIQLRPYHEENLRYDTRIACDVLHASLDDTPPFTALSYNWGSPARTLSIYLDGKSFTVTANLEAALQHLRLRDEARTLWIDALCIDQQDEIEKSEQVQQMGQIYAKASKVIAWLGPEAQDSELATKWIMLFGTQACELQIGTTPELRLGNLLSASRTRDSLPDTRLRSFVRNLEEELVATDNTSSSRLCSSLASLWTRPYWNRIWVVQEHARARAVEFMCGKNTVTEDAMHHALRLLRNFRHYVMIKDTALRIRAESTQCSVIDVQTLDPINLLKSRRVSQPLPLIHLLRLHRRFQATDPRDKVFALLGLSSDAEMLDIKSDYRLDLRTVYTSVAKKLLMKGFTDILSLCNNPTTSGADSLPSWVPNWYEVEGPLPLQQRALDRSMFPPTSCLQPRFSAGSTPQELSHKSSVQEGVLLSFTTTARSIGSISDVGSHWKTDGINQWLQDLDRLSYQVNTGRDSTQRLESLIRSSVADQEIRVGNAKPRLSQVKLDILQVFLGKIDVHIPSIDELSRHGLGTYTQQIEDTAFRRRPLLADGKYLGIGPRETTIGDMVFLFQGFDMPYLLRKQHDEASFRLIGEVYLHGVMDDGWDKIPNASETVTIL